MFLIDQALSPAVAIELNRAGHDAVHVHELEMPAASDQVAAVDDLGWDVWAPGRRVRPGA